MPIWRRKIYKIIKACPQHTFFILTKQPQRIRDYNRVPDNCWVGVSVSTSRDWARSVRLLRKFEERRFISIEPLITEDDDVTSYFFFANWIIVGAMTGPGSKKYRPNPKAIKYIVKSARKYRIPVFMKNNLKPYWQEKLIQEWPEEKTRGEE